MLIDSLYLEHFLPLTGGNVRHYVPLFHQCPTHIPHVQAMLTDDSQDTRSRCQCQTIKQVWPL